jgi:hypothetical protein
MTSSQPQRSEKIILQEVLINSCYGGFSVSKECEKRYPNIKFSHLDRHAPELLKAFDEMGETMNGKCAKLCKVIICTTSPSSIIPYDEWYDYEIAEYDGDERVQINELTPQLEYINKIVKTSGNPPEDQLRQIREILALKRPEILVEHLK